MSNTLRIITMAAMATAVTFASVPAQATGVSQKQVRNIVKQEVEKIPRVRGPKGDTGPAGPPGMDGFPSLTAHIFLTGVVDDAALGGITQDNVRRVDQNVLDDKGKMVLDVVYCFFGLPPVTGGQVTIDGNGRSSQLNSANLDTNTGDPDCPIMVAIAGRSTFHREAAGFFILLY